MRNRQDGDARRAKLQRHDPAARAIVLAWRLLTSPSRGRRAGKGSRTLVACSGGADSMALAFALARTGKVTLAHVVHDLRPREQAEADRDAVRRLAEELGVPLLETEVRVRQGFAGVSNLEARARMLRYRALADMARQAGARYVATAHHADDQLETMLMAIVRGTGLRGLRGVHVKRVLARGGAGDADRRVHERTLWLVRPMLHPGCLLSKADAEGLCTRAGLEWRDDATNRDQSRLRANIRSNILPLLNQLRPGSSQRAAQAAVQLQGAARVIDREVADRLASAACVRDERGHVEELVFDRDQLRRTEPYLIGEVVRGAFATITHSRGLDRVGSRVMQTLVRAVQDTSTDARSIPIGHRSSGERRCEVLVHAGSVRVRVLSPGTSD